MYIHLGMFNRNRLFHLQSIERILLGDLKRSGSIFFNFVILSSKKEVIYNAMKTDKPNRQQVISDVKNIYFTERYKASLRQKHAIFDKNGYLCPPIYINFLKRYTV